MDTVAQLETQLSTQVEALQSLQTQQAELYQQATEAQQTAQTARALHGQVVLAGQSATIEANREQMSNAEHEAIDAKAAADALTGDIERAANVAADTFVALAGARKEAAKAEAQRLEGEIYALDQQRVKLTNALRSAQHVIVVNDGTRAKRNDAYASLLRGVGIGDG